MPTNWVKDGLDAYLALTGENRAEKRAQAEIDNQKQYLQLAQNQDVRANASAGLQNQETKQRIDKGQREADDWYRSDKAIQDFVTMKTAAYSGMPNTLDPDALAKAQQTATDLAHAATMADQLPPGNHSIPVGQLSPSVQSVVADHIGKAAAMRKGTVHTDPVTGQKYTMTGELGPNIDVVAAPGKPSVFVPNMVALNEDGTTRLVPFTQDGTNNPEQPVSTLNTQQIYTKAGSMLAALNQAQELGISPAVAYSQNIYQGVMALPHDQRAAWLQKEVEKDTARRDKYVADAATVQAAKPFTEAIDALTGTPGEKRTAAAAILHGATSEVADYLLKTSKTVHDMFPDIKAPNTVIAGSGKPGFEQRYAFNQDTGKYDVPVGSPVLKHAPPANSGPDRDTLQAKRDVSTRLRDAQRGYFAAVKGGDNDKIAAAIDQIEALNGDATAVGVRPLPLPQRPMTSDQEAALYQQASTNVRAKQGRVAKALGLDPGKADIEAEFQRLKAQAPPRPSANDPSTFNTTSHSWGGEFPGKAKASNPARQSAGALQGAPPAKQHTGRIIRDTSTGKRYKSNGTTWQEVQ